jgi:hypothetical protein
MKTRYLPLLTIAALLAAPCAATAQQFAPKDINYLAHLWDSNPAYFEHFVTGVARFSGVGMVESNGGQTNPELIVDMGAFGTVSCLSTNGQQSGLPLPSLKPGDKASFPGGGGGPPPGAPPCRLSQTTAPSAGRFCALALG